MEKNPTKTTTNDTIVSSETESKKTSTLLGKSEPSPKRLNLKKIPPATISTSPNTIPTKQSVPRRQSKLAKAMGDPLPINTIEEAKTDKQPARFIKDFSPEQEISPSKPRLKSLIQEIGFSDKTMNVKPA